MNKGYFCILLGSLVVLQCSGMQPAGGGNADGMLRPCPASPNCVSSKSTDQAHYTHPLGYRDEMAAARQRLLTVISSFPRTRIVTLEDSYIHCEFTSALFRFVDDVEFYLDDTAKTVHLRSASRVGYYDFGVNRRRIEKIREKFLTKGTP